ncbi:MoaD/ThiS family protein [Swingsia samuiensis]|uniref:MoaD/ThiS family protein n=1 Tax=Swingsia samuiensis TaxID=1293412 RepID=A0A4Y6UKL8_9PROT|nr:MoaD/ThiS family protein [Swingsia samuiensis]QDH17340.1 MoaD/ThiS family protein [Swingsia samuiensis]
MIRLELEYFAQMKEIAEKSKEVIHTDLKKAEDLYLELKERYNFPFKGSRLRVAVNGDFVPWDYQLKNGDHVVFIPPVTGG